MRQTVMHRADVTFWRDASLLPLEIQAILVMVTTALPAWKVQSLGQLALRLPRRSLNWGRPPPHVYVGQRVHAEEILAMAELRHYTEGVVVIMDELDPQQTQAWMHSINKFQVAESTMSVTPRG